MIVYLISSETNGEKTYKIGVTKRNIEKRIKEFKTGNSSDLHIVETFKSKWAFKIESNLHRLFHNKHKTGEWFFLEPNDIMEFQNLCLKYHENFNIIEESNSYYNERGSRF